MPGRRALKIERKGGSVSLKGNFYHSFMMGSWPRLLVVFALVFLGSNIAFALLYCLDPQGVAGLNSFGDAFFFSVQTISTIGYGALTPQSPFDNAIVTVEAAFGLVGAAVMTGLVFAKVSRPEAGVMFSTPVVITQMDGAPTLCLRVGNTRSSEVVDATVNVSVLVEAHTAEGQAMRRIYDLELVRSRTPIFALTWTIMHRLDETSPLYGCDWNSPGEYWLSIFVTLGGHDAAYAQMVYDRHIYYPEDVRFGHRFVDVVEFAPGRRLLVDYDHFHDTVPEPTESAATPAAELKG